MRCNYCGVDEVNGQLRDQTGTSHTATIRAATNCATTSHHQPCLAKDITVMTFTFRSQYVTIRDMT